MQNIRNKRLELGLSQQNLANSASLSLATIQNIELGKANPSIKVLNRIFNILGIRITYQNIPTNYEKLNMLGLPFMVKNSSTEVTTKEKLIKELRIAFINYQDSDERTKHVLEATFLALRDHFKEFYNQNFAKMMIINGFDQFTVTGKHIKYRRIILWNFSRYLND